MGWEGDPLHRVSGSFFLIPWLMVCVGVVRRVLYSSELYTYIIVYETVGYCFVLSKRQRLFCQQMLRPRIC